MHQKEEASDFILALSTALQDQPLREKLLLTHSHRTGRQWLDAVALRLGGIANVRTVTPSRLMLDCAEAELARKGLRPGGFEEKIRMAGEALETVGRERPESGYFTRLPPSLPFARSMLRSLEEVDAAGITSLSPLSRSFASREKADELARLYGEYRRSLTKAGVASPAAIADAAIAGLGNIHDFPLLVIPESMLEEAGEAERRFLTAWPEPHRTTLAEDSGPCRATVECGNADTVVNEARGIMRAVRERGLPLDRVEIVCIDPAAYVPALCAVGQEIFAGRAEDLPFTFSGGIPAASSRPSRLIAAWLEWLESGLAPKGLADMLRSGLLRGWEKKFPEVSGPALASRILALPIHGEPEEYRKLLGKDKKDPALAGAESWLARRLAAIVPLANGGATVDTDSGPQVLAAALELLRPDGPDAGSLDAYARVALTETVTDWLPHSDWRGFRPLAWLHSMNADLRVMGLGPMPGRLHVADAASGGHSGREHTFIPGLDDGRFPGTVRQDPVLLDKERKGMSPRLAASGRRRERRATAFTRLLARLRGRVHLSYARHGAGGDREQYPSALFTRFAENSACPTEETVLAARTAPACLNRRDDWLRLLTASRRNILTPDDLAPWHPSLARGREAERQRLSPAFTPFDGHVPDAGADYRAAPWPISPTDLETMAANPQEYFFKRILGLKPPDRFELRPGRWLEGNERGNLLHDLFQDFAGETIQAGETIDAETLPRHRDRLLGMLEKALSRYRRNKPVRDQLAYRRERREMLEACVIYLNFECQRHAEGRPICLEAALGGAKEDEPPWNRSEPVALPLPGGDELPLKGRVDRIDRLHNHGGLAIWDYKTGRSDKFSRTDPFNQGRHLQPLLYALMLDHIVHGAGQPEPVGSFSYFFPMPRDEGRIYTYTWRQLREGGMDIVGLLVDMLAKGLFPFSTQVKDSDFSDYRPLWKDIPALAAAATQKMRTDPLLAPWSRLREAPE